MPKPSSDLLFQLIKSLSKSEKRYLTFAWEAARPAPTKMMTLFGALDRQTTPDETAILRQEPTLEGRQLSNLKAHLYDKILQGLRQFHTRHDRDIRTREAINQAQLLLNRGLYPHGSKLLRKAKRMAEQNDNLELRLEVLKLEKRVIAQGIGGENPEAVNTIIRQVQEVNTQINNINVLSNIQVRLNNWYAHTGSVRKPDHRQEIKRYLQENLPAFDEETLSFPEKLSLYDVYVTYHQFLRDFAQAHTYAHRWVGLFDRHPERIARWPLTYVRSLHKLLITQNKLRRYPDYLATTERLRAVPTLPGIGMNENLRALLFKYTTIHRINGHFLTGDFTGGVSLVRTLEQDLDPWVDRLGKHATIIFYYKIACMYFGASEHRAALHWLQRIINEHPADLREDIHCFARMLNLISHYELGNTDVIDYYIKSTYRFLLLKDDLGEYQKYILVFLKNLHHNPTEAELIDGFRQLRHQLLTLIDRPYENRAFTYFDIISWLESKIRGCTVEEVIQEKVKLNEGMKE
jgi:tetratricopeptide (TPR) repeat protein